MPLAVCASHPISVLFCSFSFSLLGPCGSPMSINYGPNNAPSVFLASCSVCAIPNTQLICSTCTGFGVNQLWNVMIGGQSVTSTNSSSYAAPSITSFTYTAFATSGNSPITINGNNFGPLLSNAAWSSTGQTISATYGQSVPYSTYQASICTISIANTQLICNTSVGVGANLYWIVLIAGQNSLVSSQSSNYAPPVLNSYSPISTSWHTHGYQVITLSGSNLGPSTTTITNVTYGPNYNIDKYVALLCNISTPHTVIVCLTNQGVGTNLYWRANIGNQIGPNSGFTINYAPPLISSITGTTLLHTAGGEFFTLTGNDFSSSLTTVDYIYYASTGMTNPMQWYLNVLNNCSMSVQYTQIVCSSIPG